ncbi:MAG: glycosyltransferase family 8 protein [Selenomonas ruminantium]|jgi:lipopolysaccharide biosynthesis glycosyltransferase|uniref:Glycosyltransferase family 8 protein n=2 Tax=Selenomonas ruminantium TaxID=971 RepID=A0A927WNG0_SELRU|nr:glycosyltransferase family 8 protein [Selenomonas ruminantium]
MIKINKMEVRYMEDVHVCFSIHDEKGDYCKYLGIALVSMLENTNCNPHIHIVLDSSVSKVNRDRLSDLSKQYDCNIYFHEIDNARLNLFKDAVKIYSIGTLFRFFMVEALPTSLSKILYLDDDLVVNIDVEELWNIDLGINTIGACRDQGVNDLKIPPGPCLQKRVLVEDYFNQGVLIINLDKLREYDDFLKMCIDVLAAHTDYKFLDQDVFNDIFNGKVKYIPEKFNVFTRYVRKNNVKECECILHFSADYENPESNCWIDKKLFEHWGRSAWGMEMYDYFHSCIKRKNNAIELSKRIIYVLSSGKRTLFIWGVNSVLRNELELNYNICKNVEAYVDSDTAMMGMQINGKDICSPDVLNQEIYRNAFVIVLSHRYYEEIKCELEKMGKIENSDFVDGAILLEKRK